MTCTWHHRLIPHNAQQALKTAAETHDLNRIEAAIAAVQLLFPQHFKPSK